MSLAPQSQATTVASPLPASRPRRRWIEFTGTQVGVLFLALILVASIPVFTHPLPPLEDYVNHLARMHVKVADPRWYAWCDRLGVLVAQDLPSSHDLSSEEARTLSAWRGDNCQSTRPR